MATQQGYLGAIKVKTGPSVAFTDVSLTDSGDQKTYIISDPAKRYWDNTKSVTVEKSTDGGASWNLVPATDYTIEYVGGRIVFNVAQNPAHLFRVDASSFPVSSVAAGFNWQLQIELNTEETPIFGDAWTDVTPTLKSASGSFSWYWADSSFFQKIGDGNVIIVLYVNQTSNLRYEFSAVITSDKVEVPNDGVVTEELEFSVVGKVYYRNS